jgi:hypothetical protein
MHRRSTVADPLVLYYAGPDEELALQARAGAELVLKRWPGAEMVACKPGDPALKQDSHGREAWLLHLPHADDHPRAIDHTPTASIAMQVWGLLNPHDDRTEKVVHSWGEVEKLVSDGWELSTVNVEHLKNFHRDASRYQLKRSVAPCHPAPPTWLRYLDDAVCGRESEPARNWLAWAQSWAPADAIRRATNPDPCGASLAGRLRIGRAILRARKRDGEQIEAWKVQRALDVAVIARLCDACSAALDERENLRGRATRALEQQLSAEEGALRLRTERDDLRERLRKLSDILDAAETIDVGATGVAETMTRRQWGRARELAEVER